MLDYRAISVCLTPGTEGKETLAQCVRVREEVVDAGDLGLVGLYVRRSLSVELSINKALEAAVSPQPANFSKYQNTIKYRK